MASRIDSTGAALLKAPQPCFVLGGGVLLSPVHRTDRTTHSVTSRGPAPPPTSQAGPPGRPTVSHTSRSLFNLSSCRPGGSQNPRTHRRSVEKPQGHVCVCACVCVCVCVGGFGGDWLRPRYWRVFLTGDGSSDLRAKKINKRKAHLAVLFLSEPGPLAFRLVTKAAGPRIALISRLPADKSPGFSFGEPYKAKIASFFFFFFFFSSR